MISNYKKSLLWTKLLWTTNHQIRKSLSKQFNEYVSPPSPTHAQYCERRGQSQMLCKHQRAERGTSKEPFWNTATARCSDYSSLVWTCKPTITVVDLRSSVRQRCMVGLPCGRSARIWIWSALQKLWVTYSETRESKEAMQVRSGRKERLLPICCKQGEERAKLRQNLCWSRDWWVLKKERTWKLLYTSPVVCLLS